MKKRKWLYGALAGISFIFIVYALADNFIFDPEAKQFLSHKTGLRRELKPAVWLNVMRIHVALACIAMATGLINFLKRVRDRSILVHRINGYVYLISVLVVVLTSGYMAPYATGGKIASIGFNAINMIWLIITATALVQIKKKRIQAHRNWMVRSYAFCFTNLSIHLVTALFHQGFGFQYVTGYTIGVYGTIALLLAIPEAILRKIEPA